MEAKKYDIVYTTPYTSKKHEVTVELLCDDNHAEFYAMRALQSLNIPFDHFIILRGVKC